MISATEEFSNEKILGAQLYEFKNNSESFKAQLELENRLIASFTERLQALELKDAANLAIEYTKVRSRLDGLKMLQQLRDQMIRDRNNK